MVSIPLRSKMANARFFVTVRRIMGAIYAKKFCDANRLSEVGLKGTRSVTCRFGLGGKGRWSQGIAWTRQLNPRVLPEV
jgi:hypothetical protein